MARRSKGGAGADSRRGRPARSAVYARLDAAVEELRSLGGLPKPSEARGIWDEIWVHEAHSSTAIEGNTLVLSQVAELLRNGRAVGGRRLEEYLEVQGYAEAALWVYGQALEPGHEPTAELLTLTETRHVHRLAMTPVWDVAPHPDASMAETPGTFRVHDIRPFPGGMRPPAHQLVPARMQDWLERAGQLRHDGPQPLMERIADVHAEFERVHPFLTATVAPGGSCSTCYSYASGIRRPSSRSVTVRDTSPPSELRIWGEPVRWECCSPEPFWTTCSASSFRLSQVPYDWCRSPLSPDHRRVPSLCATPHGAADFRPPAARMGNGAAVERGCRSTSTPATSAARRIEGPASDHTVLPVAPGSEPVDPVSEGVFPGMPARKVSERIDESLDRVAASWHPSVGREDEVRVARPVASSAGYTPRPCPLCPTTLAPTITSRSRTVVPGPGGRAGSRVDCAPGTRRTRGTRPRRRATAGRPPRPRQPSRSSASCALRP